MSEALDNPNNIFFIPKNGNKKRFGSTANGFTLPGGAPLVSTTTAAFTDNSSDDYTQGTADGNVLTQTTLTISGHIFPGSSANPAQGIINKQNQIISNLTSSKYFDVEINDKNGVLITSYAGCSLVSVDFPEGTYVNYCPYTIVVEQYSRSGTNGQYYREYSYNFDIQLDDSYGYMNTGNTDVVTSSHLVGTESITVSENDGTFLDSKIKFTSGTKVYLTSNKYLNVMDQGTAYDIRNLKYNTSVNPIDQSITYTSSFILIPNGYSLTCLGNYSVSKDDSVNLAYTKGSLNGSILGLTTGSTYQSENVSAAMAGYNGIKSQAQTLMTNIGVTPINTTPLSDVLTKNFGAGTVDFTLEYDNRNNNQVANTSYESISVTDTPSRRMFSLIPVMGRSSGPIIQDTYGNTETKRDFSIEVVYYGGFGNSSGPGTQAIENAYKPNANIIFESASTTTWNETERRFTRQKSWVYE